MKSQWPSGGSMWLSNRRTVNKMWHVLSYDVMYSFNCSLYHYFGRQGPRETQSFGFVLAPAAVLSPPAAVLSPPAAAFFSALR